MRLLYLDEAGTDRGAPWLCVAGVLVHGDFEWPAADQRIWALVEKYIPPEDRLDFVFHATDIYHGSRYFDRRKPQWADQGVRVGILNELAAIVDDLHLPVVAGYYDKEKIGAALFSSEETHQARSEVIHDISVTDCLMRADDWLAQFAPTELATVVHEDGTPAKRLIKETVRTLRSADRMSAAGLHDLEGLTLPLRRIIDTVHFAEKADARLLQLADLCAFMLGRYLKLHPVPAYAMDVIVRHSRWFAEDGGGSSAPSEAAASGKSDE